MPSNISGLGIPFAILIAISTVIFLIYYFNKKQIILRKLSKFQFKPISQFRPNELTKITGKVMEVNDPFIAPFSKRRCVAYAIKIKQKVRTGKNSYWKTLVEVEDIQDFFIEKGGELVMIKPSRTPNNYYAYLVEDHAICAGTFKHPTPEFNKVLKSFGVASSNWLGFNKALRYSERIVEIGETITVGGLSKWKAITQPIDGYRYSKIAALESDAIHKLVITDLPQARDPNRRAI
jgi:hypothetical protein